MILGPFRHRNDSISDPRRNHSRSKPRNLTPSELFFDVTDEGDECYWLSGSVESSQETSVVLGGAAGVSEVFGVWGDTRGVGTCKSVLTGL